MLDREHGYPGKEEIIISSSGEIDPDPRLAKNLHKYQLYLNLFLGGDRVLCPPGDTLHPVSGGVLRDGSYLERLPAESSVVHIGKATVDSFSERKLRSAHEPIAKHVISTYSDLFFRQHIDRTEVLEQLPSGVAEDIDLRGSPAEEFLRQVYEYGLVLGAVGVITDLPPITESFASRYQELESGRRPFCRIVLPQQIWQWQRDDITGDFLWVLIREGEKRYRMWTTTGWALLNERREVVAEGAHGFGFVPIDLFVARDPDPSDPLAPFGISAIADTALLQLQIDNHASLLDDLQRKTNFPFLHVETDPPDKNEVHQDEEIGAGYMFYAPGTAQWLSPSQDCAVQARAHLERLERQIYVAQGIHRRSQDSVEAHSGLALDFENSPIYATVQAWSSRLRSFENRFWRTVLRINGTTGTRVSISYPEDFTTRPIDLEIDQCGRIAAIYGGLSSAPMAIQEYVAAKMSRAILRDVGHTKDGARIAAEARKITEPTKPIAENFDSDSEVEDTDSNVA